MNEVQLQGLIRGILIPAGVSGTVFLLAQIFPLSWRTTLRTTGAAAGFLLAFVLLMGFPSWPFVGGTKALVVAAFLVSIWPIIESLAYRRIWFCRYLLLAFMALVTLQPFILSLWTWAETAQKISLIAAGATFIWLSLEKGSREMRSAAPLGLMIVMGTGLALNMMMEGSASLGQLAGGLCAVLGVATVLSLVLGLRLDDLDVFFILITLTLWASHFFFVESSVYSWLWVISPIFVFIIQALLSLQFRSLWVEFFILTLFGALPVGWGLWEAYLKYQMSA